MPPFQRWFQLAWLTVTLLPLYSNAIHRGPDRFAVGIVLWSAVALGTLLLFLRRPSGVLVTGASAFAVLLVVAPWAVAGLRGGIPHGARAEGNPLAMVEAVLYLGLVVLPAVLVLFLCWVHRRAVPPAPGPGS